ISRPIDTNLPFRTTILSYTIFTQDQYLYFFRSEVNILFSIKESTIKLLTHLSSLGRVQIGIVLIEARHLHPLDVLPACRRARRRDADPMHVIGEIVWLAADEWIVDLTH